MTDKSGVADESRFAYKNIEDVLHYQADLVEPVLRLKTVAVIKGSEKTGRKKRKNKPPLFHQRGNFFEARPARIATKFKKHGFTGSQEGSGLRHAFQRVFFVTVLAG